MPIEDDHPSSALRSASITGNRATETSGSTARPHRSSVSPLNRLTVDRMVVLGLCVASVGFFAVAYSISLRDPEYFGRQVLATMQPSGIDPIMTGTVAAGGAAAGDAIPVPRIVRAETPSPGDYQIVMVFEREAILATDDELWRVKVGSLVPGLGEVLAVDATETGGVVKASEATLRTVAN